MSMFTFTRRTYKDIISFMARFCWGHIQKDSGVHQKKWDILGKIKSQGKLGFRDLEAFDKALLTKKVWRLIEKLDSLAGQILKAKYFHYSEILDAKLEHNPSLIWRSLQDSFPFIKASLLWKIGDG